MHGEVGEINRKEIEMKYKLLIKQPVKDVQIHGTSKEELVGVARKILPILPRGETELVAWIYAIREILAAEITLVEDADGKMQMVEHMERTDG